MAPKRHHDHVSLAESTVVVDNGAYNIKAGYSTDSPSVDDCRVIPNCIAKNRERKVFVGSQLRKCDDFGEMIFQRPVEKGFVVNWSQEKTIWDNSFLGSGADLPIDPKTTNLILTEAPNCPQTLQVNQDQMVFEEYEFASYYRCIGPQLNAYNNIPSLFPGPEAAEGANTAVSPGGPNLSSLQELPVECLLLIDSGYSHTTITPLLHRRPVHSAIRRLEVGGKLLTNLLKDVVSMQYVNVADETVAVTEMKEALCYVSQDFRRDLDRSWKLAQHKETRRDLDWNIVVDWALPDYDRGQKGYALQHDPLKPLKARLARGESVVPVSNERFQVPELLFNPSDIGLTEAGLPDAVMQSLEQLPRGLWPGMLANIVVVGGNAKLKGLRERLETEVRMRTPAEMKVRVAVHPEPEKATWLGGARMAKDQDLLKQLVVTRQEYMEHGHTLMHSWTNKQFVARGNAVAASAFS